ncbi:MAG: acylneuraminate cytidylyltransferase family protein [Actinobacteria bacterium]|nr:acylneuraminate cytidylyltransferase family protein [Actinomycetota bacterium]
MKSIYAIIPARGGSKGIPKKNIKYLGGYPLIAYSIIAAKLSSLIERIIVSTDSEEIAEIALKYGAEVPFLRPSSIAKDNSKDSDFMIHAIDWFIKNEGISPEYWVHLRPTTPLRDADVIDDAIKRILINNTADCLRSAHKVSESPFKWFILDINGYFKGMVSNLSNEQLNAPRQEFPDVYIPDGYVDVLKTSFIQQTGLIHGEKMIGYISPFCIEVDTFEEFEILEYELKKKNYRILEYLKQNFKD